MTLPEVLLWQRLKGQPQGVKFRRQHPLGDFVLDFYCARRRIAIEIDGFSHDTGDRPRRDAARDDELRQRGVRVLRVAASDVLRDVDSVAASVVSYCASAPPPSTAVAADTSPAGGGPTGASA